MITKKQRRLSEHACKKLADSFALMIDEEMFEESHQKMELKSGEQEVWSDFFSEILEANFGEMYD